MRRRYIKYKKTLSWLPNKKNHVGVFGIGQKSSRHLATFRESLRITVALGQMFSLLPVNGELSNESKNLKFSWKSWRCTYSLLSLLGQVLMTTMCIYKAFNTEVTLNGTTPVIFYSTTCITMVMFMKLALQWPQLVQHIIKIEELDHNWDTGLTHRCNMTSAVILTLALFEHILSLQSAFVGAIQCRPGDAFYMGFVKHFYPWVFNYLPYSTVLGMLTQFLHFQSTFIWNFSNLFVVCLSYYLTSRLNNVNKKLLAAQGKYLPEIFWSRIREDYTRIFQLVRHVDSVISGIVFICFANNLFFICLQLFNSLNDGIKGNITCTSQTKRTSYLGGYEASAYFVFSLIYLIGRSVAVSLIMSQVHVASTAPATVLYSVPSPVYCVEVQRLLDQINYEKVALSGWQFFKVTRGLLLTVAGSIVTYELVMLQFNSSSRHTDVTAPAATPATAPNDSSVNIINNITRL